MFWSCDEVNWKPVLQGVKVVTWRIKEKKWSIHHVTSPVVCFEFFSCYCGPRYAPFPDTCPIHRFGGLDTSASLIKRFDVRLEECGESKSGRGRWAFKRPMACLCHIFFLSVLEWDSSVGLYRQHVARFRADSLVQEQYSNALPVWLKVINYWCVSNVYSIRLSPVFRWG